MAGNPADSTPPAPIGAAPAATPLPAKRLSPRKRRFVNEYLKDFRAGPAARRMGISARSCYEIGSRLLRDVDVRGEIDRLADLALDAIGLNRESTLLELGRIGRSDVRRLFDKDGNLKPIHELDDDAAAAIASIKVLERKVSTKKVTDVDGDNPGEDALVAEVEQVRELKLWNKVDALEKLARMRGWLKDRGELVVKTDLADLLREVVRRNEAAGLVPGKGRVEPEALPAPVPVLETKP